MSAIRVRTIATTPVKGTALDFPAAVQLGSGGVAGNRSFHLIDERGHLVNGKRAGALATVRAEHSLTDGRLTLRLAGGTVVAGGITDDGERVQTSFYGRPVAGRVLEGPWAAALSALLGQALRMVAADEPGAAVDVHPVTISSAESLAAVAEVAGADVDGRRFRMLIELEGGEPFEEEGWTGRTLRIGSTRVRVGDPVGRCAVITQDPDTGRADLPLLKVLRDERRARDSAAGRPRLDRKSITFGVYATVTRAGRVSVGDEVMVT